MRGVAWGVRCQNSFWVHLPVAAAVLGLAALLRLEPWRWAVLLLCIAMVISLELVNSAVETLVRVLHPARHPALRQALDTSAGAVLVAAVVAVVVGLIVLLPPLCAWGLTAARPWLSVGP